MNDAQRGTAALAAAPPDEPGVYALLLSLGRDSAVTVRSGRRFDLAAGVYVYVGSARGPGGLAARLSRHLRDDKPRHWHLDFLMPPATPIGGLSFAPALSECGLASLVAALPGAVPVPGFGCSDCRAVGGRPACRSHLFRLAAPCTPRALAAALAPLAPTAGLPFPLLGAWPAG